jgi:hypothetical protein
MKFRHGGLAVLFIQRGKLNENLVSRMILLVTRLAAALHRRRSPNVAKISELLRDADA